MRVGLFGAYCVGPAGGRGAAQRPEYKHDDHLKKHPNPKFRGVACLLAPTPARAIGRGTRLVALAKICAVSSSSSSSLLYYPFVLFHVYKVHRPI